MPKKSRFTTVEASTRLLSSMEVAINNMIDEIRKPVDTELSGSQRKAELQSIKQTATDAKELLIEYQRLEQMVKELKETGGIEEEKDYSGGFAERFSK
jgi:cell shape-determining protein MreC